MRQKGFTITELLIVIAVISILAATVIVAYNGITNRANDAAVQSDLEAIAGQLEAYRVSPTGTSQFPPDKPALDGLGIKAAKKSYNTTISRNLIYCVLTSGTDAYQAFKLIAASKSNAVLMITQDGFTSSTLTINNLTTTLCADQGMTLVSEGMYQPDNWQSWVGS